MLEARAVVRLYKDLLDERGAWHQRIAATLFHQGPPATGSAAKPEGRAAAEQVQLSPAGRQAAETGLRQIDRLTGGPVRVDPLVARRLREDRRKGNGSAGMSGLATQPARASGEFTIDANIPLADQLGALVARLATAAKIHPAHVVPDATGLLSGAFFCRHE